jgi:hypothetical protein
MFQLPPSRNITYACVMAFARASPVLRHLVIIVVLAVLTVVVGAKAIPQRNS